MIIGVILCCVISVQIEAGTIKPVYIMGQDQEINTKRFREQNDVYGAETIRLNGMSPRAPSWPEPNSDNEKMLLLPKILNTGDQINITGQISRNPRWFSLSLITERNGPNGMEPDYNNTASQLFIHLDSNDGSGSIALKIIKDGIVEENITDAIPSDLIPDLDSSDISEVTIMFKMIVSTTGYYGIEFYIGESYIDKIFLKHNHHNIRYLALDGAVVKLEKLEVHFA